MTDTNEIMQTAFMSSDLMSYTSLSVTKNDFIQLHIDAAFPESISGLVVTLIDLQIELMSIN